MRACEQRARPSPRTSISPRSLIALASAVIVAACATGPTVGGTVFDDRIELEVDSAPTMVWVVLRNGGSRPCSLIVVDLFDLDAARDPHRLPVRDGRVVTWTSLVPEPGDAAVPAAAELYAEVDGKPLPLSPDPTDPDPPGRVVLEPGIEARIQLAVVGDPAPGAVHVLVCDDSGDYERGRYAVLAID